MKKRLFSIFLSLALVLSMMPLGMIVAQAEEVVTYDLWVAGTQVTSANAEDLSVISGVTVTDGGEARYDASSNTLTLNGATITGLNSGRIGTYDSSEADGGIVYSGTDDFTINVTGGTSTVTGGNTARDWSAGLFIGHPEDVYNYYTSYLTCNIDINISEGADLTLSGGVPTASYYPTSDGICMNSLGQLTISGAGTLNANGGSTDYSYGISTIGGLVINSTGTVNATGADNTIASYGINEGSYYMVADRSLTISGSGTVNATGGTAEQFSAGIYAYSRNGVLIDAAGGKINATGKAVTAYASPDDGSYGIFSYNTIGVRDGTVKAVAADVGAAGDISAGLFASYDSSAAITISGGTVEATAGTAPAPNEAATVNSAGIYSAGAVAISGDSTDVTAEGLLAGIYAKTADVVVSGGTVTATGIGDTTITDHGYNGIGIRADEPGKITFSGENTVVSAKGKKTSVSAWAGITIDSPLEIVLPVGGKMGFGNLKIVNSDATNATDVLIKTPDSAPTSYPLWIAGTQVNENNASDVLDDGTVSYDAQTNTLTLNNANITGGSENINYYGWGINYRGTDDFKIVANGTNTVKDDHYRIYASYGIVIGEPSPVAYSTAAVNVTITVSDGTSLTVSGGNINQSEDYSGSWGIYNKGTGSLIINGSGVLIAEAKDNSRKSIGIVAQNVTIDSSCSVTAAGGNSGNSMSAGIYCGNLNVPQSFTGSVTATAGNALGASYSTGTFGIRTTGDCAIGGGSVTATSGFKTGSTGSSENAVGIFGENSLTISGGATVIATGDGHGLWCYQGTTSVDASSVTAIGGNFAVNDLNLTKVTAVGSTRQDGSDPVEYDSCANNTYKYVKTEPVTEPTPPGGGGGGAPSYKVEVPDAVENGSVSVKPTSAKEGDTVTITPTPDDGFVVDGVKVTDKNGKEIEVTDNGDGTYSFKMPASKVTVTPVIIEDGDVPLVNRPFVDVPEDSWFYDAVYYCYDNGYIKGMDETHFAPNDTTTRAMIVTILWRMEGSPSQSASQTALPAGASQDKLRFEDVEKGSWYEAAVNWAAENGVVKGMSETTFAPMEPITREQMATILYRYYELEAGSGESGAASSKLEALSSYDDADQISDWALDAMNWSVATELMKGVTETTLDPKGNATRAQVATLMQRMCENIL